MEAMPKTVIVPKDAAPPLAPYSPGTKADGVIYVSGTLALDHEGKVIGRGDVRAQTRAVLESVKSVIEAGGAALSDVTFNMIFLKDYADYAAMNEVYREYFPSQPPARYCIKAELVRPNSWSRSHRSRTSARLENADLGHPRPVARELCGMRGFDIAPKPCHPTGCKIAPESAAEDESMRARSYSGLIASLLAAGSLMSALPCCGQGAPSEKPTSTLGSRAGAAAYASARQAFEEESAAYWSSVAEKRRIRNAKRRSGEPIDLFDYVLTQPPVYSGPPRPVDPDAPERDPAEPRKPDIPTVADFLAAAADQFRFVPQRPESENAFKRTYARVAAAAGLTRDQVVRIYAFETGGNGAYDVQAGLTHPRPGARAISPALGYNQLLSTNSVGLLAEHGDKFIRVLRKDAEQLTGDSRTAMEQKIEALRRMIAFSRTVPNLWSEHDKLAKTTPGGLGIHAAVLDRDIGPLLQTQKLLNSVLFARSKGRGAPLTAAELEMMNFTGDGNGLDMVMMPHALRERVPTANFFQQSGYERNPIARRAGAVAALFSAIEAKMDQASQLPGAKELAAAFP